MRGSGKRTHPGAEPSAASAAHGLRPQPGALLGRACPTCPRGVFASKALKRGDVVMTVPLSLALAVRCGRGVVSWPNGPKGAR